jgi:hypothetical protein
MRKGIANSLANQIFALQRTTHGGVPGDVVASARRVKEGVGNNRDLEAMRNYLGIKRTGATAMRRDLSQISQRVNDIGQIGVLGTQAAGGGAQGAFAGLQLAQVFARQLELSAKSGHLRKVLDTAYKKPQNAVALDRLIRAGALQQLKTANSIAGNLGALGVRGPSQQAGFEAASAARDAAKDLFFAKNTILDENKRLSKLGVRGLIDQQRFEATSIVLNQLRNNEAAKRVARFGLMGGARMAGVVAGYAAAGVAATKTIVGLGESLGGLSNLQGVSSAMQASRIANADPMALEAERKVARLQVQIEKDKGKRAWMPFGQSIYSRFADGRMGEDQGFAQTRGDLTRAGLSGNVDKLRKSAQEKILEGQYGAWGGRLAGKTEEALKAAGFSSVELEQKISAEVQKTLSKFQEFYSGAQSAAGARNFQQAQVLLNEANKTLPGAIRAWEDPKSMYTQQLGDRAATRLFAASQMARAGDRTGD